MADSWEYVRELVYPFTSVLPFFVACFYRVVYNHQLQQAKNNIKPQQMTNCLVLQQLALPFLRTERLHSGSRKTSQKLTLYHSSSGIHRKCYLSLTVMEIEYAHFLFDRAVLLTFFACFSLY